jgi:mono/diheme cytochrome c family protein
MKRVSRSLPIVATCFLVAAVFNVQGTAQQAPAVAQTPQTASAAQAGAPANNNQAVLQKYCVTCHNQRAKVGGLALDALDLSDVGTHVEEWEKVVRKVRTGRCRRWGGRVPTRRSLMPW